MLKITATGNLTSDVTLRTKEDGEPFAVMRIASDRRYRAPDGSKLTDFVSIKVRGPLAERCARLARKGGRIVATGDFETIVTEDGRQIGCLIKAADVEIYASRCAEGVRSETTACEEGA